MEDNEESSGMQSVYVAQPRQNAFHSSKAKFRFYGGAAGGGKTEADMWECVALMQENRNASGLLLRKTYPELEMSFIRRFMEKVPQEYYDYHKTQKIVTWRDTGSTLQFGHCADDDDVYRYQGAEYDFICIDEVTQFSEFQVKYLLSRLRTSKSGRKTKFFCSGNPGGIGHAFIKRWFIDKEYTKEEIDAGYRPEDFEFIPAYHYDNTFLDADYVRNLMLLPEKEREQLLNGRWDVFKGKFFEGFLDTVHCEPAFEIPKEWKRYRSIDFGRTAPFCCLWFAVDYDGKAYCVTPETKILNSSLEWVEAGSLKKGDGIIGFDENVPKSGKRRWKPSIVEEYERIIQPCYRVTLSDGSTHESSENHLWLIETPGGRREWRTTSKLQTGDSFLKVSDTWEYDQSYDAGYLAAALDGEGHLTHNNHGTVVMGFCQRDNSMLKEVKRILTDMGVTFSESVGGGSNHDVHSITVTRKRDIMRILGSVRPKRLLDKFKEIDLGGFSSFRHPKVVDVTSIGQREVISMRTSTRTYIANGFASHNCYREYYMAGQDIDQNVSEVLRLSGEERYEYTIVDSAVFAKTGYGETIGERMARNGLVCLPADKRRSIGWATVKQFMHNHPDYGPKLKIFFNCPALVREMTNAIYSKTDPEDLDTRQEDHALDALRYLLMTLRDQHSFPSVRDEYAHVNPVVRDYFRRKRNSSRNPMAKFNREI